MHCGSTNFCKWRTHMEVEEGWLGMALSFAKRATLRWAAALWRRSDCTFSMWKKDMWSLLRMPDMCPWRRKSRSVPMLKVSSFIFGITLPSHLAWHKMGATQVQMQMIVAAQKGQKSPIQAVDKSSSQHGCQKCCRKKPWNTQMVK